MRCLRLFVYLLLAAGMQSCSVIESIFPAKPALEVDIVAVPEITIPQVQYDSLLADFDIIGYPHPHSKWVDSVYETLSPRGRLGQLITEFTFSRINDRTLTKLLRHVRDGSIGGVIFSRGDTASLRKITDTLKRVAQVPLLFSADFEYGPGMRLTDGYRLPSMMAIAATRSPDLAYRAGVAVAAETRALGIGQNYAPVCDVNNNAYNPIINTRSFGENRELVAEMAEAYMRGMQDGGLIATAKHFPGHGDTDTDSHSQLPFLRFDRARLDSLELYPFRRLIDAGVLSVMPGHLAVPTLTRDSSLPATLSHILLDSLLRGEMGFRGLIVSDAMTMKALTRLKVNNLPATAIAAGIDMLLMPSDVHLTLDSLEAAILRGELDSTVVARSVKRVLSMKEWNSKWSETEGPSLNSNDQSLSHAKLADAIAEKAVTLIGNTKNLLPIKLQDKRVALLSLSRDTRLSSHTQFAEALRAAGATVIHIHVEASSQDRITALRDSLSRAEIILVAGFFSVLSGTRSIGISTVQRHAIEQVEATKKPHVVFAFGSPYFSVSSKNADAWVCSYSDDDASLKAAVSLLCGDIPARGRLPVQLPGIADFGEGVQSSTAKETALANVSMHFRKVDSLIEDKIKEKAFPGAQLLVRLPDGFLYRANYGRLSYDSTSAAVTYSTLYDLASLTKVIATTSAIMRLYEDGCIDLDSAAAHYLPEFGRNGKEKVTIRQLLQHRSGLEPFRLFYRTMSSETEVLATIYDLPLQNPADSRTVYSDLGMIVLGKIVERLTGQRLNTYVQRILFEPLQMKNTMFNPPDSVRSHIAPTEIDTIWRKRMLQGEVHDETASLLGGVAGHAGLFSNAEDLARFAELLLNYGATSDTQLFRETSVQTFTRRVKANDSRALGWDLRSIKRSSAGRYFSTRSFGHTGFTGTSIWIDPEAEVYVIFLTNRVHPDRSNQTLPKFRAVLHDTIREVISAL